MYQSGSSYCDALSNISCDSQSPAYYASIKVTQLLCKSSTYTNWRFTCQDRPWTDVCMGGENSPEDIQYRNTVWDMFQEETKYLTKLLQPLELVSMLAWWTPFVRRGYTPHLIDIVCVCEFGIMIIFTAESQHYILFVCTGVQRLFRRASLPWNFKDCWCWQNIRQLEWTMWGTYLQYAYYLSIWFELSLVSRQKVV